MLTDKFDLAYTEDTVLNSWTRAHPQNTWNALLTAQGVNTCVICAAKLPKGCGCEIWCDDRGVLLYGFCSACFDIRGSAIAIQKLRRVRQNSPLVDASKVKFAEFPFKTKGQEPMPVAINLDVIDRLIMTGKHNRDSNRAAELDEQIELYSEVVEDYRREISEIAKLSLQRDEVLKLLNTKTQEIKAVLPFIDAEQAQAAIAELARHRSELSDKYTESATAQSMLEKQLRTDLDALGNLKIERTKFPAKAPPLAPAPQPETADLDDNKMLDLMTKAARCGLTNRCKEWKVAVVGGEPGRASAQKTRDRLKSVLQASKIDWYHGDDIDKLAECAAGYSMVLWFIRCSSHSKKLLAVCRRNNVPCVLLQSWGTEAVMMNVAKSLNLKWE